MLWDIVVVALIHAQQKKVDAKVSNFHEYGKVIFSLLLLAGGIIMNALDLAFFREGYVSLIWYIVAYLPVGIPVMKEAWESIREKDYFSEFTLMIIATWGLSILANIRKE